MRMLKSKEVAEILGVSVRYFRINILHSPQFPKPIVIPKATGGKTQPRWSEAEIKSFLKLA